MIADDDLIEITPKPPTASPTTNHVAVGVPVPKAARLRLFSPDEWEEFVEEWATSLFDVYEKVRRLGGSGDFGVDVAGFRSEVGFAGAWENYQCKHYDHPLQPNDIWVEIGKIIYYSHKREFAAPKKYFFVCPKGIGTAFEKLLNNTNKLKEQCRLNWDKHCKKKITSTMEIPLEGEFLTHFDDFDFSIFTSKSALELIDGHATTQYHAVRFGGGLPPRPKPEIPPPAPTSIESRYIRQLLDAYGDHLKKTFSDPSELGTHKSIGRDFLRQRERFYHAESLRNFARDTVPEGTFDDLQDEIYQSVIDICEDSHADGFARMKATVTQAAATATTSNPLAQATKTQDRQGICHQLANDDRLNWVPDNE